MPLLSFYQLYIFPYLPFHLLPILFSSYHLPFTSLLFPSLLLHLPTFPSLPFSSPPPSSSSSLLFHSHLLPFISSSTPHFVSLLLYLSYFSIFQPFLLYLKSLLVPSPPFLFKILFNSTSISFSKLCITPFPSFFSSSLLLYLFYFIFSNTFLPSFFGTLLPLIPKFLSS
jgi:hypothetical protein